MRAPHPKPPRRPRVLPRRGSTLGSGTPMSKVSKRRAAEIAAETPVRQAYVRAHPRCEFKVIGGFATPPCFGDLHVDEVWTRARGGPTDDPRNFATACDGHNTWKSQTPEGLAFAETNGLIVSAEQGPSWIARGGRMAPGTTYEEALASIGIEQ